MILGITGGTGCGKTTLLNVLRDHGCLVLDCDAIYHELLLTDTDMLGQLMERFPDAFQDGMLNRKKLGSIVFADPAALEALNAITHGAVRRAVLQALSQNPPLAAIDAIALFESGLADLCDLTIAVTAPLETRVQRLMTRDNIPEAYARSRIAAQKDEAWFRRHCNYTLENDTDRESFTKQCLAFLYTKGIID